MATTRQRDADLTEKTKAAITAEGSPPVVSNKQPALAPLQPTTEQPSRPKVQPSDAGKRSKRMCRMFFPSSGRMGFDLITDSDELPPVETVRDMIVYETRLRLSQPIQELMDLYHTDEDSVT